MRRRCNGAQATHRRRGIENVVNIIIFFMKSLFKLLSLTLVLFVSSCAFAPQSSWLGAQISQPTLKSTDKVGKSCGFLIFGDTTISTAAQNGKINKVKLVEYSNPFLLFPCTVVTGE